MCGHRPGGLGHAGPRLEPPLRRGDPPGALETRFEPEDLNALEMALQVKDRDGGEVHAFALGEPRGVDVLRECLYRGVDAVVRLSGPAGDLRDRRGGRDLRGGPPEGRAVRPRPGRRDGAGRLRLAPGGAPGRAPRRRAGHLGRRPRGGRPGPGRRAAGDRDGNRVDRGAVPRRPRRGSGAPERGPPLPAEREGDPEAEAQEDGPAGLERREPRRGAAPPSPIGRASLAPIPARAIEARFVDPADDAALRAMLGEILGGK